MSPVKLGKKDVEGAVTGASTHIQAYLYNDALTQNR